MNNSSKNILFIYFACAFLTLTCTSQSISSSNGDNSGKKSEVSDDTLAKFLAKCERKKFLYYAPTKSCHHVYRRGPCKEGEYLMYSREENAAKCEKNPCRDDGVVRFNDTCYKINARGPCDPWDAVVINKKTLQLECGEIDLSEIPIFSLDEPCPKGYHRTYIICRKSK